MSAVQRKKVVVSVVMEVFVDHYGDSAQGQAEAYALETVSTAIHDASMGDTDPVREHLTMVPIEEWFPVIKVTDVKVADGG